MQKKDKNTNLIQNIIIVLLVMALGTIIFIGCYSSLSIAFADGSKYIQAEVSNLIENETAQKSTLLVSTDDDSFYIPESYYVEILSKAFENTYHANYMGLACYVTIENIQTVSSSSTTLFPSVELTIKDGEDVTLITTVLDNTYSILLMGYSEDNSKIYVKATKNESSLYGFIDASKINRFTVPYESLTQANRSALLESNSFNPNEELKASTSKGIRIAIIVCLGLAIVIITILLFVGKNKERHTSIKDEGQSYDEPKF